MHEYDREGRSEECVNPDSVVLTFQVKMCTLPFHKRRELNIRKHLIKILEMITQKKSCFQFIQIEGKWKPIKIISTKILGKK